MEDHTRETSSPSFSQQNAVADDQTDTQYIHRIPDGLRNEKSAAYVPRVVSLGPLIHSDNKYDLNDFKEQSFPGKKLPKRDEELEKLTEKIKLSMQTIRDWYSPTCVDQNDEDLCSTMARNGLFLLQFLSQISPEREASQKAARFISQIQEPFAVQEDIMKLENQIPLFVLRTVIEWEAETYQWKTGINPDRELKSILRDAGHKLSFLAYRRDTKDLHIHLNSWRISAFIL